MQKRWTFLLVASAAVPVLVAFAAGAPPRVVIPPVAASAVWVSHGSWLQEDKGVVQPSLATIAMRADGSGLILTSAGALLGSDDGVSWTPGGTIEIGNPSIAAGGSGVWLVVGRDGRLLRSTDQGSSWVEIESGVRVSLHAAALVEDIAVAVGSGVVLRSSDTGETWEFIQRVPVTLHDVALVGSVAVAVGGGGTILRSVDGGLTWGRIARADRRALHAVAALDSVTAVAVGSRGAILFTSDFGQTWEDASVDESTTLTAVTFGAGRTGVAVGLHGVIVRTLNGGRTWTREESGTRMHLLDVTNSTAGPVAIGWFGTILTRSGRTPAGAH